MRDVLGYQRGLPVCQGRLDSTHRQSLGHSVLDDMKANTALTVDHVNFTPPQHEFGEQFVEGLVEQLNRTLADSLEQVYARIAEAGLVVSARALPELTWDDERNQVFITAYAEPRRGD